jgi:hypothetical protein
MPIWLLEERTTTVADAKKNEIVDMAQQRPRRQPSRNQIIANQNNARRSTGPRTDAGKRASSENATKSGIWVTQPRAISRGYFAEDETEIARYIDELMTALDPRDALENETAKNIATQYLRLQRLANLEPVVLGAAGKPYAGMVQQVSNQKGHAEKSLLLLQQLQRVLEDATSDKTINYEALTQFLNKTALAYQQWKPYEVEPTNAAEWLTAFQRTRARLWKDTNAMRQWIDAEVQSHEDALMHLDGEIDEYLANETIAVLRHVAETNQRIGRDLERALNQYQTLRGRTLANHAPSDDATS